jgi:hypothetical protein
VLVEDGERGRGDAGDRDGEIGNRRGAVPREVETHDAELRRKCGDLRLPHARRGAERAEERQPGSILGAVEPVAERHAVSR